MPKSPKPGPRPTRAKAARPEVHPINNHLAALLNAALVDKPRLAPGFAEAPQRARGGRQFAPAA